MNAVQRSAWWVPAVYLCLSLLFFAPAIARQQVPLPLENAYTFPDPYWQPYKPAQLSSPPNFTLVDLTNYYHPYMLEVVARLQRGEVPLWNPHIYSGMPLLAAQQAAVLYPPNLLFIWLGPLWIWVGSAIVRLWLMGWGMHLLLRRFGVGTMAAFWAGITYQFSGSNIVWLHFVVHNVLAFLPLALYATDRLLAQPRARWWALLTACLASQFLGGHPETSVLFALVWGSFTLVRINWRGPALRSLGLIGLACFAAVGLVLPQLWPTINLIPASGSFARRTSEQYLSLINGGLGTWRNLRHWLFIINPYMYGTPLGNRYLDSRTIYHGMVAYLGVLSVPWIVAGIVGARSRRMGVYWTLVALISLTLTFPLPGFDRLLMLPVLNIGNGIRFILSWSLAASVLAGLGVDWVLRSGRGARWLVGGVGTACVALLYASVYDLATAANGSWVLGGTPGPTILRRIAAFYNRDSLQLLGLLGSALIGWALLAALVFTRRRTAAAGLLLAVTCVELLFHGVPFNGFADPRAIYPPTRVTRALRQTDDAFRIATLDGIMKGNTSMTQGLDNALGEDDLAPFRYQLFAGRSSKIGLDGNTYVVQPPAQRFFDLANVRYLITTKPVREASQLGRRWSLFARDGNIRVYQNESVLPRAFIVPSVRAVTPDQALGAVYDPAFDPRRQAVVEGASGDVTAAGAASFQGATRIVSYEPERVVIDVNVRQSAFLVFSDSYTPDWQATIDGQPTRVYRANAVYRGVALPAGARRVEFTYRPASWRVGRVVAGFTLLGCMVGCWLARRRRLAASQRAYAAPGEQNQIAAAPEQL